LLGATQSRFLDAERHSGCLYLTLSFSMPSSTQLLYDPLVTNDMTGQQVHNPMNAAVLQNGLVSSQQRRSSSSSSNTSIITQRAITSSEELHRNNNSRARTVREYIFRIVLPLSVLASLLFVRPNKLSSPMTTTYTTIQQNNHEFAAVCLTSEYGRNCNAIIEVANAIVFARQKGGKLGLSANWTKWYLEFFDPRDEDVLFNVPMERCNSTITAESAFRLHRFRKPNNALMDLIPKQSVRQAAQEALDLIRHNMHNTTTTTTTSSRNDNNVSLVVSVHRRWLEGTCIERTANDVVFCFGPRRRRDQTSNMCNMTYQTVTDQLRQLEQENNQEYDNITKNAAVVLFTDEQVPELDNTFPLWDEHPFPVQLWMMAMSDVHFGTPPSSIDMVVYHWRRGLRTQPSQCYPPL
jgi:hypothetical protein